MPLEEEGTLHPPVVERVEEGKGTLQQPPVGRPVEGTAFQQRREGTLQPVVEDRAVQQLLQGTQQEPAGS